MLQIRAFSTDELTPYQRNPRRGDVRAIAESLATRGQYRPIVVNEGTFTGRPNEVLAGNHTLAAAIALGWPSIEATTVDVDDAEAARIVLADNRLADLGSYDDADLAAVLARTDGILDGTGFTDADLAELLAGLDVPVELTDPDAVPALPVEPVSRVGDVWLLGRHRLLVGDSGETAAVLAACGDWRADAVWTDPPYGVDYVGKTADALTMRGDGGFDVAGAVARASLETAAALAQPGAPVYIAHPESGRDTFLGAMREAGMLYRETLIWVKDSMVLGHADYHYRHEPILYGFTPDGTGRLGRGGDRWYGNNSQTTVFEVARPKRSKEHPTMKPVELVEAMLVNSARRGGRIFDPFAGSGSTLIAAQRLGMSAFVVEYDPRYADVICRRFEEFTGQAPVRDGEEVSFT